jgi:catechol 2,3-dioxygenase-like lactoylglutathione lyase family enzyme
MTTAAQAVVSPGTREATPSAPSASSASGPPAELGRVDHVALSVTDLLVSERFYTDVLGFVAVMSVPGGRICMHPQTGFVLALLTHADARGGRFSELNTGVDHLGLAAASRDELERWERHLAAHGVTYTPTRDELFGSHLNFRDPDGIALELASSNDLMIAAQAALRSGPMKAEEIAAFITEHVGADFVVT